MKYEQVVIFFDKLRPSVFELKTSGSNTILAILHQPVAAKSLTDEGMRAFHL
jgi:hypothetical protein